MLKSGVFSTGGYLYHYHEVEETGYYRIDFAYDDFEFQVDFDKVIYSIVTRRMSKHIGDSTVFTKFNDFKAKVGAMQLHTETVGEWKDGAYISTTISTNTKLNCKVETIKVNGVLSEHSIVLGEDFLTEIVADPIYGLKLDPINFSDYTAITLSKDNIELSAGFDKPYYPLNVLRRRYDIAHVDDKDYCVAQDIETARARLKHWVDSTQPFKSFDTETSGTDVSMYGDDKLVGIVLGEDINTTTYFPFRHDDVNCKNLPLSFLDELMHVVMEQESRLVGHNKSFDRQVMMKEGYDLHIKWDTLQLAIIIDPSITADHSLKHLATLANGKTFLELKNIFINTSDIDFSVLPVDIVQAYACPDGTNTLEVLYFLLKQLPDYQQKLFEIESDLADVKADQEYFGIRVDVKRYEHQYQNCNYITEKLLELFRTITREDGNINSAAVLVNLIYNKMHCPTIAWTNTGQPSTSTATIEKLASEPASTPREFTKDIVDLDGKVIVKAEKLAKAKYPALVVLSVYKKYIKLKTAFYARFERTMKTGRVFFWINQNGAASGRQSSPMHQLPPSLKECILSDTDSHDFWGPDFSQIELRMIAYLAGEKDLIELASDPDNDIHRVIGSLISGKEMWAITPQERGKGKKRNFGFVYGISGLGLAKQMYGPNPTREQIDDCSHSLDELFHRFKRIDRYVKQNAVKVKERGYMETAWFHRRRYFPEVNDPDIEPRRLASIIRMGNNMPVQGTAADYLKLAEVQMDKWIREKGWNKPTCEGYPRVRMMLSIHDEIILSADRTIPYEEIIEMITRCMETPVEGAPPFFVQPAKMSSWGDHAADKCAMPIGLRDKLIEDYNRTGVSVINCDNYMQVLKDYRTNVLHDYMENLIRTYGTDYQAVGTHVRHPSLTHNLLAAYEDKLKGIDVSHEEKITLAAKCYLEERMTKGVVKSIEVPGDEARILDHDLQNEMALSEANILVNFDADGNVIYEESDAEITDADIAMEQEEVDYTLLRNLSEPTYVWELGDAIVFDVQEIKDKNDVQRVLNYIGEHQCTDGFYQADIIYADRLIDTHMRLEKFDVEAANKLVKGLSTN